MTIVRNARHLVYKAFQPLVRRPRYDKATVSDLFFWRRDKYCSTYYDLVNVPSLVDDSDCDLKVRIVFFDPNGIIIDSSELDIPAKGLFRIHVNDYIGSTDWCYGTFAVFSERVPKEVLDARGFLAERGYCSYAVDGKNEIRHYVHGNIEAVAYEGPSGRINTIGSISLKKRRYRVQYSFMAGFSYSVVVVNPTNRRQEVNIHCYESGISESKQSATLSPMGVSIFSVVFGKNMGHVEIESRLVMARPTIFLSPNVVYDVFHA